MRGYGWALRNLVDAAAYYPDASPMKAYLAQKVTNNLDVARRVCRTARNPITNPFRGLWVDRRPEGPRYRGAVGRELPRVCDRPRDSSKGSAGGLAHRDAIAKFQLLLFTSEPDYPRLAAAPYVVGVGTRRAAGSSTTGP